MNKLNIDSEQRILAIVNNALGLSLIAIIIVPLAVKLLVTNLVFSAQLWQAPRMFS